MLSEELTDLVNRIRLLKTEMQTVELKAANNGCPKRLYDTLSSFANQDAGGILIFGISEDDGFSVTGVYDLQDLQKKVTEQCKQMVPPIRALFTVAEIDGKSVCSAEIPAADPADRPCFYSGAGRLKGSYVRVGDADLPMTEYEIYSYEAYRKRVRDDERTDVQVTLALLDQDKVQSYIERMKAERPGFSKLDRQQICEMLAITRGGIPTLAAVLNFGIYPQGCFPQLAVTAIVVPGTEIGDISEDGTRFQDNRRIEGTLQDMLAAALSFCKRNMKVQTRIDPETGARSDKTEYPMEAIREAVLNALIHRDYSRFTEGTPVQLDFFVNRLEIHSPGGLYGRLTVKEPGKVRPDLRNPALAAMSEFLLNTENRYSGIPTIRREMKEAGLPEPVFEDRRNEFVVTLYNTPQTAAAEQHAPERSREDLLAYCKVPRSRQEIADHLGISTVFYVMKAFVRPLLQSGALKMTIPDKPASRKQKFVAAKQ